MRADVITVVVVAFAIALTTRTVQAAPRVVRGVVTSAETGRLVVGATVLTERGDVAVTDTDGYFAVTLDPASAATPRGRELTITAPGFATRSIQIPILDDERLVRVALVASRGSEVIEVSGTAPEETRPLSYQLTADEIRFLPGAANDILRAAQALPGVSRIPFAFGGLVLRGTSPRDTAVYLDGVEVPIAFHFGGITSFYPGSMLSELTVTSGGFDASHGRAQGGLVTLTTREPRTDVWRVGGSIGLLDSSVFAEGPIRGGGIIVGVRRSYLDTVVSPFVDDEVPLPSYYDVQVRTSFGDPRERGRITPMIVSSVDRIVTQDINVTSLFVRAAVPFTRIWGALTLRVVPWIGWGQLSFTDRDGASDDTLRRPSIPGGVRSELLRDHTWGHLRGGLDVDSGYLAQTEVDVGDVRRETGSTLWWTDLALWGEARVKIAGDRASVKPGLRLDYYGISRELVVDPRLNIHQQLTPSLSLRQAIGRYHQPPIPADLDTNDGNPALNSSYMDQASLGLDAKLGDRWLASLTSFASYGHDIGVHVAHGNESETDPNLGGLGPTFQLLLEKQLGFSDYRENLGRARQVGVELLVKRSTARWFFMLAYTLSWSQRVDDPRDGQGWRPFELDQRHNLNVAGSLKLTKWRLGARIQLVTGNPYSPTINFTSIPVQDPFAGRLPTFFHLDVRADRRWERDWGDINLYFDIVNATNHHNVEGRDYVIDNDHPLGYDEDIPGLPILPFIGVEFIPN